MFQNLVDMSRDLLKIFATVPRHALPDRCEVFPEVSDGLNGCRARMVGPKGPGRQVVEPGGEIARVGASYKNPWSLGGVGPTGFIKRKLNLAGEMSKISDRIVEGQVRQVDRGEMGEGRGIAPVAVFCVILAGDPSRA